MYRPWIFTIQGTEEIRRPTLRCEVVLYLLSSGPFLNMEYGASTAKQNRISHNPLICTCKPASPHHEGAASQPCPCGGDQDYLFPKQGTVDVLRGSRT